MSSTRPDGTLTPTPSEWALSDLTGSRQLRVGLGVLAFVVATAIGARIAVPLPWLTPVPMTLQPLFVILAGALLGPWAGATSMGLYLAIGAAGLPVFSMGGAGIGWLMGPTGGYLVAYPASAFVVGALLDGGERSAVGRGVRAFLVLSLGVLLLYLGGVSQLWILTRQELGVLVAQGMLPFLAGDLVKVLIALVVVLGLRGRTGSERAERR